MGRLILILGGARSGKSTYALELAKKHKKVAFIATCQGLDDEMKERIRLHQQGRPKEWKTYEEPKDLLSLISNIGNEHNCILIDCLTLLVSNLILDGYQENDIIQKIKAMIAALKHRDIPVILVSNETGLGIVPDTKLGREFRDIAGKVNQVAAAEADEVFFMFCGLASKLK